MSFFMSGMQLVTDNVRHITVVVICRKKFVSVMAGREKNILLRITC